MAENDSHCACCNLEYQTGFDKKGNSIYINKYLSRDFIPDQALGGRDGGDTKSYCTECYIELFDEDPTEID